MSELAVMESSAGLSRWVGILVPARQLADVVADTDFVPSAMRGKPDVVCAAIMYGDELGVGPMQALAGIHVVEGRPQPSAELARALILRDGHSIQVHESTGDRCRVSGLRHGRPEQERAYVEWTRDMARAAGLLGRTNWQRYPRAMLLARATGDLARMLFPDVVKGLSYVAEDDPNVWDGIDTTEAETAPEAPRKAVQRRRKPKARDDDPPALERPREEERVAPVPRAGATPPAPPDHRDAQVDVEDVELPVEEPPPDRFQVEPEVAPPEPGAPDRSIAPPVLRALHARMGKVIGRGPDDHDDREARLALVAAIVGRPVESTGTLTRQEGYRVLDFLTAVETGEATWETDPDTGVVTVVDLREPPGGAP